MLGRIFGELAVAQDANGDGEHQPAVVAIERADRIVVAGSESFHHRRVETCIGHGTIVADRDRSLAVVPRFG